MIVLGESFPEMPRKSSVVLIGITYRLKLVYEIHGCWRNVPGEVWNYWSVNGARPSVVLSDYGGQPSPRLRTGRASRSLGEVLKGWSLEGLIVQ